MGRKGGISNVTVTPPSHSQSSSSSPPQTSIISKRTYTRQVSNNSNSNSNSSSCSQKKFENASETMNEMRMDDSLTLGGQIRTKIDPRNNDILASNGRSTTVNTTKGKQKRSIIGKQMAADNSFDAQATTSTPSPINNTVSSIAQRPRRQVKHKFIKSANINLIDKSNEQKNVQNKDVDEQQQQQQPLVQPTSPEHQQQPLDSLLHSLSPNSRLRLVPLIYRLPVNTAQLSSNDVISQLSLCESEVEVTELSSTTQTKSAFENCAGDSSGEGRDNGSSSSSDCIGNDNGAIISSSSEPTTTVHKEMKTERHKKLSNSKQAIRRGRQLRQTVCPVSPAESDNGIEMITTNEVIEQNVQTSNISHSGLTSAFDDEEDDIMIVEEKDALDVPDQVEFVAEEVIIEESNDDHDNGNTYQSNHHYTGIVCVSPSQFNQNIVTVEQELSSHKDELELNSALSKGYENNNGDEADIRTTISQCITATTVSTNSTTAVSSSISSSSSPIPNADESELIELSDSLSCFDSDTEQEDLDFAITQHKVETNKYKNVDQQQSNALSDLKSDAIDENDEMDGLNLSTDDVIIVQSEYVEPIEVDQSDSDDERFANKYAFESFIESDSQPTSDQTISKCDGNEHITVASTATAQKFGGAAATSSSFDEATSDADADDDSSEVDKRGTRSRRDNTVRKNYSIRRTYARRKLKSDTESPVPIELNHEAKNENCSDDNKRKNTESPLQHSLDMDDPVNNCTIKNEMNSKLMQSNDTPTDATGHSTGAATDEDCSSMNVRITKAPRTYVRKKGANATKSVSCDTNKKNSAAETTTSNDAETKPTVADATILNPLPRKRGRPRKKPISLEINESTENVVIPSPPLSAVQPNDQQSNSEQQINGPIEIEQLTNLDSDSQKSNDLQSKTFSDELNETETPFENDCERRNIDYTDEINSKVSSIKINTESVQQLHENNENVMEIEMAETIMEETHLDEELSRPSESTEINIADMNCHSSETELPINIRAIEYIGEMDSAMQVQSEICHNQPVERPDLSAIKTEHLNENLVEMIESSPAPPAPSSSVEKTCETISVAENEVSSERETAIVTELPNEDIVCDKFTKQLQIIVEQKKECELQAITKTPIPLPLPLPFEAEPMTAESTTEDIKMVDDIATAAAPPPPPLPSSPPLPLPPPPPPPCNEKQFVDCISQPIKNITVDVKPNSGANSSIPLALKQQPNVIDASSSIVDIKSDTKQIKIKSEPKQNDEKYQKDAETISGAFNESFKESNEENKDTSIRRSGRIRTINKSKQHVQGLGLVKDKGKRAPFVVDDDSSSVSFDMSTDNIQEKDAIQQTIDSKPRIKSEEELEKEKIDRENGMKLFLSIIDNEYRSERTISKEAKKMTCDCFLTRSEFDRGEMGCGDDCLNRMLLIECGPKCVVGERCTNRRFQKHQNSSCNIFKTEKKGYGLIATDFIPAGQFIMEYVGEVLNSKQFEKRANDYSKQMNAHYYFMALSSDCVIDATKKGNISRFINHSCDPNAETQKWTVNGELRIGFFSKKSIMADEEITFDYQFQRYGKEAQKCFCESVNCRGWIGGEPESEEELESDDDDESEDETVGKDDSELSAESKVVVTTDETAKKKVKTPKPKKPKDATKKPAKKERAKANRKTVTDFKKHMKRAEIMEDPDLDMEIDVLSKNGLKNQVQTLQLSRLMVRAKLQKAKVRLLTLLRDGELPCRRLFLDYHGLKLIHSWMSDVNSADRMLSLTFRLEILQTLENLPITNKTALQDSKVLSNVQRWSTVNEYSFLLNDLQTAENNQKLPKNKNAVSANDESSPSDSGSGTPISNDDAASSPKIDEVASGAATPNIMASPLEASASASQSIKEIKPSLDASISPNAVDNSSNNVKSSDVLDAIPQILERNSTIKGMNVDLLKSIISTSEKNTKIIEVAEKLPDGEMGKLVQKICLLASKLVSTWEQLPESFKIPKKLRIEQMKEHEREADESYKENVQDKSVQKSQTFSSTGRFSERTSRASDTPDTRDKDPREKDPRYRRSFNNNTLSKHQRRQLFEAKVAQKDADRRKVEEYHTHEQKCAFFQLDPRVTRDFMVPLCVNPTTGQWFNDKMMKVQTPPSHAHIQPPPVPMPTDVNEYNIPSIDLPDLWKYAITEKGQIYYYHTKILIPQWEPPIKILPLMEEHRINDIDLKTEPIDASIHSTDDDHEMEHDCDDEDDDVVSILSNSTMNPNCLLELKSDPILEKYNDDDSSSTDSDDSLTNELAELEAKYSYIKRKTDDYWMNMKRPPNLNEEIAAMAKSDSNGMPTIAIENHRSRDDEKLSNVNSHDPSSMDSKRKRKKNRSQLVQTIRISPLSEEMKRELRRDSRRYKENKAKLRRQKEILLKRKCDSKLLYADAPVRKLKKITEGLPQVSKHGVGGGDGGSSKSVESHLLSTESQSFPIGGFSSSRFVGNESFESKRTKPSAFAPLTTGYLSASSLSTSRSSGSAAALAGSSSAAVASSLNTSLGSLDLPSSRSAQSTRSSLPSTSLTQSIVNKLPSIGHKFAGDTEELIMKNTIKPIRSTEPVSTPVATPVISTTRSTPTQQSLQQLVKKQSHSMLTTAKSSSKSMVKKKKTSDSNESIDGSSPAAKKIKEKFKSDISGDIVRHLKPYLSKTCTVGQIQNNDDFRHLARKLTYFVMLKELKYCNNVSLLEVTDSVKNKAREYIKKYMSKFGKTYIRDENDKDYHYDDL